MRNPLVASFVLSIGALLAGGCESSPPSRAARTEVAPVAAPVAAAAPAGSTMTAASTTGGAPRAMCGASCGGQCGGQSCGGGCMHGGGEVALAPAPADAQWTSLHVTGMHCGGCAKRIKKALASVEGVVGVEVDLGKAEVRVATTGDELLARVTQTIDGLGFKATAH